MFCLTHSENIVSRRSKGDSRVNSQLSSMTVLSMDTRCLQKN